MATQAIAYLEAIVGADITSFRRGMAEVRAQVLETAGLGSSLRSLGTSLTLGLTVPLAAVGIAGVKVFTDLDAALRNVNSVVQMSETDFQKLQDRIVDFGMDVREGALGAANALNTIVQSGFGLKDINEAFQVMEVSVNTAEAGLADLNITTQAIVSTLLAYGQGAGEAANVSNILTRAIQVGVGSMEQFAGSVGLVLPTASLLGVTFKELSETAAFLTQRGLSWSEAFVSLNGVFRTLINPGDKLIEVFNQLGVSSGEELLKKFNGLEGALKAIMGVAGTSSDALAELFTEIRAYRGAASILGNFDDYASLVTEFGQAVDGATSRAHAEQAKSLAAQLDILKASLLGFLSQVGERLAPMVGELTDTLGAFFKQLARLDPVTLDNAIRLGLLAAAIPPIIFLVGALLSPIGLITTALVALAHAINTNFLGLGDTARKAFEGIRNFVEGVVGALSGNDSKSLADAFANFIEAGLSPDLATKFTFFFADLGERVRFFVASFETNLGTTLFYINYYVDMWKEKFLDFIGLLTARNPFSIRGGIEKLVSDIKTALSNVATFIQEQFVTPLEQIWSVIQPRIQPLVDFFAITLKDKVSEVITEVNRFVSTLSALWSMAEPGLSPLGDFFGNTIIVKIAAAVRQLDLFNNALAKTAIAFALAVGDPKLATDLATVFGWNNPTSPNLSNPAVPSGWQNNPNWGTGTMPNLNPFSNFGGNIGGYGGTFTDIATASGYLTAPQIPSSYPTMANKGGVQNNTINIQSNNPDYILRELRRQGIDLSKSKRG